MLEVVAKGLSAPSRSEVADKLDSVLAGHLSRSGASTWAMQWVAADADVADQVVWDILTRVGMIDLTHGEGEPYLFSDEQVAEWRAELG